MIRSQPVQVRYAKGYFYVAPFIYDSRKWSLYSPEGVCLSVNDSKREAEQELRNRTDALVANDALQAESRKDGVWNWPPTA